MSTTIMSKNPTILTKDMEVYKIMGNVERNKVFSFYMDFE